MKPMTTTDRLLHATEEIWQSYHAHPFVQGIRNGDLPKEKFRYYILQDYLYLVEYTKVFAIGIAKAKSQETLQLFSQYIAQLTGSEMNIHHGYMGKLAVTEEELAGTERHLDNLSYTSYMLRVAYEEGEAEILTAILSCACSYEHIAKEMVRTQPNCVNDPFYGEWIQGYASDEYAAENTVLLSALDRLTTHYTEPQLRHLTEIFTACSRYEARFWDLSWQGRN